MGVRFLETYLEKESREACYHVHIRNIVQTYKGKSGNQNPVIVVDGLSCLNPLYSNLNYVTGGQFKEFYEIVEKFINNFTQLGCKLVIFLDGVLQNAKIPAWKRRRLDAAERLTFVFDNLDRSTSCIETEFHGSCWPYGIEAILSYLCNHHGCQVIKSVKECDEEIATYASENKCFAILAQDSDFVIYRAAEYYLSAKNLNLDNMTTLCYCGYKLSSELGFPPYKLSLLATLVGNDIVPYDSLKNFHNTLRRMSYSRNTIILVAEYIKRLKGDINLTDLSNKVFGTIDKSEMLANSLSSYAIVDKNQTGADTLDADLIIDDGNWSKIVQYVKENFTKNLINSSLYDIIIYNRYFNSASLEDFRPEKMIMATGNLLKELRRSMYGILLYEQPLESNKSERSIEELVMTGFESMENTVQVKPKYLSKVQHPGLLTLWTSKDSDIQVRRYMILGEIFNIDSDLISQLPLWLIVPALSTRYVKSQYPDMTDWELDALIATNVCVRYYETQDLSKLPADPLTYRAIWIFTALTRTYTNVCHLLYYIGNPISTKYTILHQYADGKLYHCKYRESRKGATPEALCEHRDDNLSLFNQMKRFVAV